MYKYASPKTNEHAKWAPSSCKEGFKTSQQTQIQMEKRIEQNRHIYIYMSTKTTYIVLQNPNLHDMILDRFVIHI